MDRRTYSDRTGADRPKRNRGIIPIGPSAVIPKIAKLRAFDCPNLIQRGRSAGELGARRCGKR